MATKRIPRIRNDAALSTGLSSAVDRRRLQKQEELHNRRNQEKEAARVSLTRDGSIVDTWIDKELANVNDFTKMVTEFDPESFMKKIPLAQRLNVSAAELLQAQTIARLMYIDFLKSAKTKVKNTLKQPTVREGEGFGEGENHE